MIERWEALGNFEFLYILPQYICIGIILFAIITVIASSIKQRKNNKNNTIES